jgi:ABC-type transport system substrate-binding protein
MRSLSATPRFVFGTFLLATLVGLATGPLAAQTILRLPSDGPARTFDPHAALDPHHLRIQAQLYEAPLECVIDEKGLLQVAPALCELPEFSEDRKTLRLRVRPGARFHDDACFEGGKGRDATAADVVASLLRHADPDAGSVAYPLFVKNRFVGVEDWRAAAAAQRGADYAAPPLGMRAEGDVVVLRLVEPYPALRALLTQPWASVMPTEAIRKYGPAMGEHPVGTGAFRLGDQDAARLRLVKHAGYRLPGKPGVDELRFENTPDPAVRVARFATGDLDLIDVVGSTEKRLLDARSELLAEHKVKGRKFVDGAPLSVSYLVFNCKAPIFAKPAMRRAVQRALDRGLLAKALLGDRALRADGPLPPVFPEATTFNAEPWKDGARDVPGAKVALKEAGYADPASTPEFAFDFPTDVQDPRLAKARDLVVAQLKEAGFRVTGRSEPMTTFYERVTKGDFALAWTSWFADYPDAENFLLLFRSDKASGVGWESNFGRYADDTADKLYLDLASRLPGKDRLATATTLLRKLRDDAPWVPIAYPRPLVVVQKNVSGFAPNLLNWSFRDVVKK